MRKLLSELPRVRASAVYRLTGDPCNLCSPRKFITPTLLMHDERTKRWIQSDVILTRVTWEDDKPEIETTVHQVLVLRLYQFALLNLNSFILGPTPFG